MKIGILGGTFDPIHEGHLQLAQSAQSQFALDKVIFVPAYQPPHKQTVPFLTPAPDRYKMVLLAIEGRPLFEVSDCELNRKGVSYTYDTVVEVENKYPGALLFLILGKDSFDGVGTWHRAAELKEKVRFLVARRETHSILVPDGVRAECVQMPLCPISSSGIREALRQGRSVERHLCPQVIEYIQKNALYRETNL